MYFDFNTNSGKVHAWLTFDFVGMDMDTADVIAVNGEQREEVRCKLYNTADNDLAFKFNGEEILVGSAIIPTMSEVKHAIETNGRGGNSDQLMQAIMGAGVSNVRFTMELDRPSARFGSFAVCTGEKERVACKIVPGYNRMPHGNYKLKFEAVNDEERERLCRDDLYTSDMIGLIRRGYIEILDPIEDGKSTE